MIDKEDLMRNNQVFSNSLERQVTIVEVKATCVKVFDKKENCTVDLTYEDIFPLPLIRSRVIEELKLNEVNIDGKIEFLGILDEERYIVLHLRNVESSNMEASIEIPSDKVLGFARGITNVHKLQNFIKSVTDINFISAI